MRRLDQREVGLQEDLARQRGTFTASCSLFQSAHPCLLAALSMREYAISRLELRVLFGPPPITTSSDDQPAIGRDSVAIMELRTRVLAHSAFRQLHAV
jgi:hypothetical protein